MPTYPFYSVKVKNSQGRKPKKKELHQLPGRTSFFPYDRFYLFHKEDTAFADRMFYVYLKHKMTPEILEYLTKWIDLEIITSLGPTSLTGKVTRETPAIKNQQSNVAWHVGISKIEDYILVVPTYTYNILYSNRKRHKGLTEGHVLGYTRSKYLLNYTKPASIFFEDAPVLIVNKEVLGNPCTFCERFIDGFQSGLCTFGHKVCMSTNTIFTPNERIQIQDDDIQQDGATQV